MLATANRLLTFSNTSVASLYAVCHTATPAPYSQERVCERMAGSTEAKWACMRTAAIAAATATSSSSTSRPQNPSAAEGICG